MTMSESDAELYFDDLQIGYREESSELVVDPQEMVAYAERNDPWPIHTNEEAAKESLFGERIASFGYVVSLFFRAVHELPMNQASQRAFRGALEWRATACSALASSI